MHRCTGVLHSGLEKRKAVVWVFMPCVGEVPRGASAKVEGDTQEVYWGRYLGQMAREGTV